MLFNNQTHSFYLQKQIRPDKPVPDSGIIFNAYFFSGRGVNFMSKQIFYKKLNQKNIKIQLKWKK